MECNYITVFIILRSGTREGVQIFMTYCTWYLLRPASKGLTHTHFWDFWQGFQHLVYFVFIMRYTCYLLHTSCSMSRITTLDTLCVTMLFLLWLCRSWSYQNMWNKLNSSEVNTNVVFRWEELFFANWGS